MTNMNTGAASLLPCPFCGSAAYIEQPGTRRQSCIVECGSCGLRHESGDEGAMCGTSWNRRATPQTEAAIAAGGAQEAMQMLLSKVPIPPNAITFDKGWELLDELQRVALLAASNGEKKNG
jgi:Lar family restriction alleviation protein